MHIDGRCYVFVITVQRNMISKLNEYLCSKNKKINVLLKYSFDNCYLFKTISDNGWLYMGANFNVFQNLKFFICCNHRPFYMTSIFFTFSKTLYYIHFLFHCGWCSFFLHGLLYYVHFLLFCGWCSFLAL